MISLWLGFGGGIALIAWVILETPGAVNLVSWPAMVLIFGGTLAAVSVQEGLPAVLAATARALRLLLPGRSATLEQAAAEISRLARRAQAEGGLLALQGEGSALADDGFLRRALNAASTAADASEVRAIMEAEISEMRRSRVQESEVFQAMASAAPILGLMGTLLGMVRVVSAVSDPVRMGPAMALALSSDFVALGLSQLICSPLAGRLMAEARREVLLREVALEGALGIMAGRPIYRLELQLAAYVRRRQRQLGPTLEPAGRRAAAAA
ncbi:MAG: MotA/TolQ/ExbB proton channel family protein [Elusimicrobia bacterium]|nr:MotA/TolQ/ExbB proton channel family protein [Elusimicrobiota bacterium]MDE2237119.1 MotA/TolQ/ExbB proton channel family protein [Elusimicrobiota bacterium]MDE2426885.1 MotA/TolQ/ExbB proton channel family protein [Elusimicrobiota bacterium]